MAEERGRAEEPGALLARADAARDARRWAEAAEAYGAYLRQRPDDRGILVQRGHCLKESGDPAAALALYRQAEAMETGDADVHLQIGHALKLLGRRADAAEAYGRAMALDPAGPGMTEWRALLPHLAAARATGPVLDLSDLVSWYGHRRVPSGIQRVQAEIAAAVLDDVTLCAMRPGEGAWRAIPASLFRRLHHLSGAGSDAAEPAWREALSLLADWLDHAPPLRLGAGAVLVTLGSAWWLPRYAPALRAARAAGARHVPVLHDCGPLVLPELSEPGTRGEFARWFSALPVLADGVVAVSHTTAAEYRRLMARHLPDWPAPPVMVVPPDGRPAGDDPGPEARAPVPAALPGSALRLAGLSLRSRPAAPPRPAASGPAHPALPAGPYVLLVSSLEPRKNHLLALAAWRMLLDRRGAAGTPRLVLAGRRAPGDAPVLAALEADPALAAQVTLLHDLDDAALARLYRGCLFTLYPSRHEGWGLPVSESLLHGRVPLVSEIPALMESGRHGAVFFTPNSAEDLATAAEGLIADPARLAAAAARIPRHGGLRPWPEVAEDLLAAVRRLSAGEHDPWPSLPLCRAIGLSHDNLLGASSALARAEALRHGAGWHAAGDWGNWTRPGRAELRLPAPDGEAARVALSLRPPPGGEGLLRLTLGRAGASPVTVERQVGATAEVTLEIAAGGPELQLVLESDQGALLPDAEVGPGEGPEVGVGVVSVALMHGGSLSDRVAYLESRILVPAEPL